MFERKSKDSQKKLFSQTKEKLTIRMEWQIFDTLGKGRKKKQYSEIFKNNIPVVNRVFGRCKGCTRLNNS